MVSIAIFIYCIGFGFSHIDWFVSKLTTNDAGFWYLIIKGISFLIVCMFTSVVSFIGLLVIGGIFIDFMIENELVRINALKKEAFSLEQFFKQNLKSIVADLVVVVVIALCAIVSFLLGFIPFLSIVPILIGMFTLGLSLFDRVMSVATYSPLERTNYFKSHKMQILVVGCFFTVIFCIPFASIIFMPPALLMVTDFFEVKKDEDDGDEKIFEKLEEKEEVVEDKKENEVEEKKEEGKLEDNLDLQSDKEE